MIDPSLILKSRKKREKFKKPIIDTLTDYFAGLGYHIVPYARFDIPLGDVLSNVDMLLVRNDELVSVKIKSCKDKTPITAQKFYMVRDFVDSAYIATDYTPKIWPENTDGRIIIQDGTVNIVRESDKFEWMPRSNLLMFLKIDSLMSLLPDMKTDGLSNYELAEIVRRTYTQDLRLAVKRIVTCQT